jgi:hypothetical protein
MSQEQNDEAERQRRRNEWVDTQIAFWNIRVVLALILIVGFIIWWILFHG